MIFSLVDLENGFHQMRLHKESRPLTAFITPFGTYMWTVLPMGVKLGPHVFQRMLSHVLQHCYPRCSPYINDVLSSSGTPPPRQAGKGKLLDTQAYADPDCEVPNNEKDWGKCLEYHSEVCRQMICPFAEADLTVKPSRCHSFVRQVKYVGHILRNGKRFLDPSKTQGNAEWKWQDVTSPKALKGFLGLANWYSIYIHKYADYAAPLMDVLQGKYQYKPISPELEGTLDGNGKPVKKKKIRPPPKTNED